MSPVLPAPCGPTKGKHCRARPDFIFYVTVGEQEKLKDSLVKTRVLLPTMMMVVSPFVNENSRL